MFTPEFSREVRDTCRQVVRERVYSPALVVKLIDWLYHPMAPIRCDARVALQYLGAPAFHDLFACINDSSRPVEPDAICVLGSTPACHDEILPRLRAWAQDSTGDIQSQATLSLAGVWREKMKAGETPDPQDVELCRTIFRKLLTTNGASARLHWREFIRDFGEGNA
jgi:hypothetical protein